MRKKTIGIIGGMGPLATMDLFRKIILHTKAASDQEHLHILIDNNTSIPDRTAALLGSGEDPLTQMARSALRLEKMGADFLIMPCNTAHCYYDRLQAEVHIPILHMVLLTCQAMRRAGIVNAGLLATTGTVQTGIYQNACHAHGISLSVPFEKEQQAVMEMIYQGVKAGRRDFDARAVEAVATRMLNSGAQTVILGCTELPLAVELYRMHFPCVDPTLELAKSAICFAGGTLC